MSQMSPAVNLLDPITASGREGVAQTATNLNEAAKLRAEMTMAKAQLDTQKIISDAQIKSQESEHAKYQDFLSQEQAKQQAAQVQQENLRFQHEQAMAKQNNDFMMQLQDRKNGLELAKQKAHIDSLRAGVEGQQKLQESRAKSSDDLVEADARINAANADLGDTQAQMDARLKSIAALSASTVDSLNQSELTMHANAESALQSTLDQIITTPEFESTAGESFVDFAKTNALSGLPARAAWAAMGKSTDTMMQGQAEDKAALIGPTIRRMLAQSVTEKIVGSGVKVDPAVVKDVVSLGLEIAATEGSHNVGPAGLQPLYAKYKDLIEKQGDPLFATEMKYAMDGLGKSVASLRDISTRDVLATKVDEGKAPHKTVVQNKAIAQALDRLATVGHVTSAAGVQTLDPTTIAVTVAKLKDYVEGRTGRIDLPEQSQGLLKLADKFYQEAAGQDPGLAARLKARKEALQAAIEHKGKLDVARGLLDTNIAAETAKKQLDTEIASYESMLSQFGENKQ